jgi:hypothetical protein
MARHHSPFCYLPSLLLLFGDHVIPNPKLPEIQNYLQNYRQPEAPSFLLILPARHCRWTESTLARQVAAPDRCSANSSQSLPSHYSLPSSSPSSTSLLSL